MDTRWSYWNGAAEVPLNAPIDNSEGVRITAKLYGPLTAGAITASPNRYADSVHAPALILGSTTFPGNTTFPGGE